MDTVLGPYLFGEFTGSLILSYKLQKIKRVSQPVNMIQISNSILEASGKLAESRIMHKSVAKSEDLQSAADEALSQIKTNYYQADLIQSGIKTILQIGMAFCVKDVVVKYNQISIAE